MIIHNKQQNKYFSPAVYDDARVKWEISGTPGKFTFTVYKDDALQFQEGDIVQLEVDGTPFFYGYIFIKNQNKNNGIQVTAYDQLRYLKNKESYQYKAKKASDVITELAGYFQLNVGKIADTGFVIDKKTEDNVTVFDIMQNALDTTLVHTKKLYVLYDDFNKLMLKEPKELVVPILIDNETAQNFTYESSIDKDTYNLVKLVVEDKETGEHKVYFAHMSASDFAQSDSKKQWGILQYYEKLDKNVQNPQERANQMHKFYNVVRRKLTITGACGDTRVRAGSIVYTKLTLNDVDLVMQKMLVTSVEHVFYNNSHFMDLTLKGGVINDK
ncbi:MAG: XkdQ/YqbQ family protein [Dialister pneumosintes]